MVLFSNLCAAPIINGTVNAQEALSRNWGQRLLGRAGSCVLRLCHPWYSLTKRKNHSMSLLQSGRSITIRDFHKGIRDIVLHTLRSQPR